MKFGLAIRKQANFNNDAFLVGRVDSFIKENFEKVIADSVEFTQLPCIRVSKYCICCVAKTINYFSIGSDHYQRFASERR